MKQQKIKWVWLFVLILWPFYFSAQVNWESLEVPVGGYVSSMDVGPEGEIYALVGFYGLYKSWDNGTTWTEIPIGPGAALHIYSLSDGTLLMRRDPSGLWRSDDGGQSWSLASDLIFNAVIEVGEGLLFGATIDGIYSSSDYGVQWCPEGLEGDNILEILEGPGGELYALANDFSSYQSILYRSTDMGGDWLSLLERPGMHTFRCIAVLPSGKIVVQLKNEGTLESVDAGDSWSTVWIPCFDKLWVTDIGGYFGVSMETGLWESEDEGSNWFCRGLSNPRVSCVQQKSGVQLWVGTQFRGIAKGTENKGDWVFVNQGIVRSTVKDLAMDSPGSLFALDLGGYLHEWDVEASEWNELHPPEKFYQHVWVSPDHEIILGAYQHLTLTSNRGNTWWETPHAFEVDQMAFGEDGTWFASKKKWGNASPFLYRSQNKGTSWENITPEVGGNITESRVFLIGDNNLFFYCESSPSSAKQIFRSLDGGLTWGEIPELNGLYQPVMAFGPDGYFAIGKDAQTGMANIYHSPLGASWELVGEEELGERLGDLAINSGGHLFLQVDKYILRSTQAGMNWTTYSQADALGTYYMLLAPDDRLYATQAFQGVWRTELPTTPVFEILTEPVFEVGVSPNPAISEVVVAFNLPVRSEVFMEWFDLEGKILAQQPVRVFQAGLHQVPLSLGNWPQGVYLLRVRTNEGVGVVKVMKVS